MKTSKISFFGKVHSFKSALCAALPLMVISVTSFTVDADAACSGTIKFKPPTAWSSVYVAMDNSAREVPASTMVDGYYVIDLATYAPDAGWNSTKFKFVGSTGGCGNQVPMVSSTSFNTTGDFCNNYSIPCPGSGNTSYVAEDPLNLGNTYIGSVPPDAKYFYVKAPQTADWVWATPMVREQGSATGVEMKPVEGRCGWFSYVWDQAHVPGVAEVYSKEDPSLMLGDAVPLGALLSDANPKVYYSDGDLLFDDPGTNGSCAGTQGTALYFLPPADKEWQSAKPMFRATGTLGALEMTPAPGMCGWYVYKWGVGNPPPTEGYIFRSTDTTDQVGYYGFAGDFSSIPVKQLFIDRGGASLYFIPDPGDWIDDESLGWYGTNPGVDGTCEFKLAAVIYDTDENLNPLFTSDGYNGGFGACTGVRHGIVKTELGADKKPVFNAGNSNASLCAGDEAKFKTLFNYTAGVNEVQCYDMTFRHYGSDPRWGFDSDSAVTDGNVGGFYPVENTSDATVVTSISPQPCPTCRNKRYAQGPVPTTAAYKVGFDQYCNTPGFFGGKDCEGLFANGDWPGGVWDWGASRWSGTHNQQFCFESHATFTYSEDQEFTFRGDDDIWVFINGKIAVDNGGAHLAAPGHVVLKNLNQTYGEGFLVAGQDYPLDIFFCDRRTTMSNVIIKTNMFIKQSSGLDASATKNSDGSTSYNVCYDRSGDGDCASVALGSTGSATGTIHACGDKIKEYGNLKFSIATRAGDQSWPLTAGQKGMQYGGIDLSDPFTPKISTDKMGNLPPGSYRLVIDFCTADGQCDDKARTFVNFRIKGTLDIITADATYTVGPGEEESKYYKSGTKWTYHSKGMAGSRVPVYISAIVDNAMDPLSAPGQTYTLTLSEGMIAYAGKTGDARVTFPKTVGESGVDTVWIYQSLSAMTQAKEVKTVKLKATASIEFIVPELHFAEVASTDSAGNVASWKHPIIHDPDSLDGEDNFHWIGSDVDLYLLVWNPIDNEICTNCEFTMSISDASKLVNGTVSAKEGVATVTINSKIEYMDSTAFIVVSADDKPDLIFTKYDNLRFREPPVPYPVVVDIFDADGPSIASLAIPEPYHSDGKHYLDGKADSLAVYYNRAFQPGPDGEYKDSLPDFLCINWDEDNLETHNFVEEGKSTKKRDTTVQCSYIFEKEAILAAFKARPKGVDSVLQFAVKDTALSVEVKTAGDGKVLNYASFADPRRKDANGNPMISKESFTKGLTDRIAPVIVSARVDGAGDKLNRFTVRLSEPVDITDTTYSKSPFTFYMNSATEVSEDKRYASPSATTAPTGMKSDRIVLVYDKTQEKTNPTPRLGDYVRFRADTWLWKDMANVVNDTTAVIRAKGDADMHWNSPTNYNSKNRVASPWTIIVGDYSVEVSSVNLASMDAKIDAKNTPVGEAYTIPTNAGKDEIKALYPNTLGYIVKSDMSAFISKDANTEKLFENKPELLEEVYFDYEVQYYTNLGGYVAKTEGRIYCKDDVNMAKYKKQYFDGKDCQSNPKNFYLAWNMLSDKKRLVGTGAYIAKLSSYVYLGKQLGKARSSKADETSVWGAKRGKGLVK